MKAKRNNLGVGDAPIKLGEAITDWHEQTGDALDCIREKRKLQSFANVVSIPYSTLKYYLCTDKIKRRVVGISVGRAPLLKKYQLSFLADVLARKDRVNEGASPSEAIEYIRKLNTDLSFIQEKLHFNRTLAPGHPDKLKKHKVKAQSATTRRLAITLEQQFR